FFFFSSRRRHTRSKRDWSSDVCSSDLVFQYESPVPQKTGRCSNPAEPPEYRPPRYLFCSGRPREWSPGDLQNSIVCPKLPVFARSEERRVGKGCSVRWSLEYTTRE